MPPLKQAGGPQTDAARPGWYTEAAWIRLGVGCEGVRQARGSGIKSIKINTHVEVVLQGPELLKSWRAEYVIRVRGGRKRSLRIPRPFTPSRVGVTAALAPLFVEPFSLGGLSHKSASS